MLYDAQKISELRLKLDTYIEFKRNLSTEVRPNFQLNNQYGQNRSRNTSGYTNFASISQNNINPNYNSFNNRNQPQINSNDQIPVNMQPINSGRQRCTNCGGLSHVTQQCLKKNQGSRCFKCNDYGHIAKFCINQVEFQSIQCIKTTTTDM